MVVQMWVGGRCCPSLKGGGACERSGSGCQNHSLMTWGGAGLVLCSGPWDLMSLINKLLICTMCLQRLWMSHWMMRKYVSLYSVSTWDQAGQMKKSLGVTYRNYYPQSIIKKTVTSAVFLQTSWIIKDSLNDPLAFLGVTSLKIPVNTHKKI